jgi:hypothetical protein
LWRTRVVPPFLRFRLPLRREARMVSPPSPGAQHDPPHRRRR